MCSDEYSTWICQKIERTIERKDVYNEHTFVSVFTSTFVLYQFTMKQALIPCLCFPGNSVDRQHSRDIRKNNS